MIFKKNDKKETRKEKLKNKRRKPYNRTNNLLLSFTIFVVLFFLVSSFSSNDFDWDNPDEDDYGIIVEDDDSEEDLLASDIKDKTKDEAEDEIVDETDEKIDEDKGENKEELEYGDIKEDEEEDVKTLEENLEKEKEDNHAEGELLVHYIDVGQGDAILIEAPNKEYTLIDGGPRSSSKDLIKYLQNQGIVEIKNVVATHPHEDHIGGLIEVLNTFPVKDIYMPNITHTTKTFENLLHAIDKNDVNLKIAEEQGVIDSGQGYENRILYPISDTDRVFKDKKNLNLYSIINYVEFGNTNFLFTGDAEVPVENYLANQYKGEIKTTVLKSPHHGSNTSSSEYFLDVVKPKIVVISSGQDNKYGHPHKEVIKRYKDRNMKIFNTKEHGSVVVSSDGNKIKVKTEK